MNKDLTRLFSPRSVAVVGASTDGSKLGSIVLANLLEGGYKGKVYPVNLKKGTISGLVVYESVIAIPEIVDLAVIATPVHTVSGILNQIGEKGIKNVVVYTAGYKEAGDEGKNYENELKILVEKHDLNLLGPNCLGFINTSTPINATFGAGVKNKGNFLVLSQSGAIASSVFDWADATGVGLMECVTLGNKSTLSEIEVMEYWEKELSHAYKSDNEASKVYPIGMYLESISSGVRFVEIARKLSKKHPMFILKPGKTEASKMAMQSHTGAIAGADYVLNEAFSESGMIRCDGVEEFFDLAKVFSWEVVPNGPGMAIVSNAGGPAVMSSDVVEESGMELAKLSSRTKKVLEKSLPRAASVMNPIDVLGDALSDRYENAIKAVLSEKTVDIVVVILTPQVMTEIEATAKVISDLSKKHRKPILASFMGGSQILVGERYLHDHKIPTFRYPERAIWAASKMWKWNKWKNKEGKALITSAYTHKDMDKHSAELFLTQAATDGSEALDAVTAEKLLNTADIHTPPSMIATTILDARDFVQEHMYPVVLKLSSDKLLHKKDVGGVIVGIETDEQLVDDFEKMTRIQKDLRENDEIDSQIMIQSQVKPGVEMIVGVKKDESFGNVLLFGAGGTYAELVEDRNLLLPPINKNKLKMALEDSRIYPLLNGYRGGPKYDTNRLVDQMIRLFALGWEFGSISEMEINPMIVNEDGVWAVDGKVLLKK